MELAKKARNRALYADEKLYYVSRAAAGCYNMMVGEKVFNTPFEMMEHSTKVKKISPKEAFSSYFSDGGIRHRSLEEGARYPYLDFDGSMRAINVVPGDSFTSLQL